MKKLIKKGLIVGLAVAFLFVSMTQFGLFGIKDTTISAIYALDINPSFEISVNKQDSVAVIKGDLVALRLAVGKKVPIGLYLINGIENNLMEPISVPKNSSPIQNTVLLSRHRMTSKLPSLTALKRASWKPWISWILSVSIRPNYGPHWKPRQELTSSILW
jgi:hypothetical protein